MNADDHLGVGWGSQQDFRVREEEFNKGDKLCVMEIHYDTRKNLEARGIVFSQMKTIRRDLPSAFSFKIGCKPPKGW